MKLKGCEACAATRRIVYILTGNTMRRGFARDEENAEIIYCKRLSSPTKHHGGAGRREGIVPTHSLHRH
jgi:hypothetical protein